MPRVSYKEHYHGAEVTKDFRVLILKITSDYPEVLNSPIDLVSWKWSDGYSDGIRPAVPVSKRLNFHTDFLDACYRYSVDYEHEISEEFREVASKKGGVLLQKVWNVYIQDCNIDVGTTAEELANSVSWELSGGDGIQDLKTKILSAKFSSSFFTKCAILSDVFSNKPNEESLIDFFEYNDIGLPLAHRANLAGEISDLDGEDLDNLDCIEETWQQLCEALGVDEDGDFTSFADMTNS